jgi:hypothetical protein
MTRTSWLRAACAVFAITGFACSGGSPPKGAGGTGAEGGTSATDGGVGAEGGPAPVPFEPLAPAAYLGKVKNLLVALPPTDDELQTVSADPSKLKTLIAGWMKLPEYDRKMERFFELAFQQTQVSEIDFDDQAYPKRLVINRAVEPLLIENATSSFARTMQALVAAGEPFTKAATTKSFMLTTALKETLAFLDVWQVSDSGTVTDRLKASMPKGATLTVSTASGPIPIEQTLDPKSPNYMHWYNPDLPLLEARNPGCGADPITMPMSAIALHWLILGSFDGYKVAGATPCKQYEGSAQAPQLTAADFSDWTMVTIREPRAGEAPTAFYDLPALRNAKELVLAVPRVGFFTTPAFFANWQTNTSNQMRVTLNQALIVALGAQVDGVDGTMTPGNPPPGLDAEHASAGAACLACHQTLDPLRSIFSATYSVNYHLQDVAALKAQPGMFAFQGVVKPMSTVDDFAQHLATHPLFAPAWVQKLCTYANSARCDADDPEFQRIVAAFESSGFSWNALVAELFSSPLVTNATATETAMRDGVTVAVTRRDHLCAALDARLGFTDVCGRAPTTKAPSKAVAAIASGMPSDGYGRGAVDPVLPNDPSLFYRAGMENLCASIAALVIDVPAAKAIPNVKTWSSANPDAAIADLVGTLLSLPPSDARAPQATAILKEHFTSAIAQKASAGDALKSTFTTACLSPSMLGVGL